RGLAGGQLLSQEGYAGKDRLGAFGSYQWLGAPALKPNDLLGLAASRPLLHGAALADFLQRAAGHCGALVGMLEDLPLAANRVRLVQGEDAHGVPLVDVVHDADPATLALAQRVRDEGLRILAAAGAEEAWAGDLRPLHNLGGTPMGRDPQASVTDGFGRTHDHPNLFVAGNSLFPSAGAVHPTFTTHALALRAAEQLVAEWGDYAG
ncbi:MAG TPA: GMC family oxidoreductase, partial [Gammaproteobacteria bacterium]